MAVAVINHVARRSGDRAPSTRCYMCAATNGTMTIGHRWAIPDGSDPARAGAGQVTFEPGARSNWHTHPLGQTLICTSGYGYVQSEGGPIRTIRPGDVVWCPPNEKHWHGASLTTAMTHIAIQEELNGKVVDWMEKVTDEQYSGPRDEQ